MKHSGLTLLEITVVLIIIGLLIGGITVGRTLIDNAEQQAVIREYGMYVRAINEFKDKYQQLPGDMTNATTLWGTDPSGCAAGLTRTTPLSTTQTCDGNGNGHIGNTGSNGAVSNELEWWRAWKHMANAGFVDGKFTGTKAVALQMSSAMPGLNVPASDVDGAGWTLFYYQLIATTANMYGEATGGYGHIFTFGGANGDNPTNKAILTAPTAFSIDSKIDDGKPGLGSVRSYRASGGWAQCTDDAAASQSAQTYRTDAQRIACALIFIPGV